MTATTEQSVATRLSTLDRFLPVWIGLAMAGGLVLGRAIPSLDDWLNTVKIGTVSLPIAIGLLVMMYPVLAKVKYNRLGRAFTDRRALGLAMLFNWIVGPIVMFVLAWLMLPDLPEYRTGLIIVGLAPCIAMVLIWNDLAGGERELAAVLVTIDAVIQVLAYALLAWFYLEILPGWLGLETAHLDVTVPEIAKVVVVFLGIPLAAGFLTRTIGERTKGSQWYEEQFLPRHQPHRLVRVAVHHRGPLRAARPHHHRASLGCGPYRTSTAGLLRDHVVQRVLRQPASRVGLPATDNGGFTAAGNNFELAIAVSIGVFGVTSGEALAGVVGPLIEVPVLVGLVYVALWARHRFFPATDDCLVIEEES